jgi:Sulfotransferase family
MNFEPLPAVFVVGAPRSGTTLLRFMLDSHPDVAIPPETAGLVPVVADLARMGDARVSNPVDFVRLVTHLPEDAPAWPDFSMSAADLLERCRSTVPFSPAGGLRAFYTLYAEHHGKRRWGDKTPLIGSRIADIETLLPEARFVHIIRDGRDVACSWQRQWFSPSDDVLELVSRWHDEIVATRLAAQRVTHYVEVRFEDLIEDPATVLQRICLTIDLDFHPTMIDYYRRTPERLREHRDRVTTDGQMVVSHARRLVQQQWVTRPPSRSRIGLWRFEPVAWNEIPPHVRDMLAELSY